MDKHGTHVAGTITATGGNSKGVAGVNWNVTYISAKFLGRNGGTTADAVKAIDYITDLKTRHGLNIIATNNSWGGGGFSQALLDAINRGGNAGILFIAAAGNGGSDGVGDNNDTTPNYPSNYQCTSNGSYDCVIAVAAITSNGSKASFSNYGATSVDLGAPGSGVWSTLAYNTYASYSGTSMATPHVTGAAALYASMHSGAAASDIKAAILNNTISTVSLSSTTATGGRLNVGGFCQ
ncbi:Subtilase family protein [Nitrosomonas communis]|uniref:Subtilase family protein n=1 Tax=Nitrosomonas communis TaxID=44574 RepID=A0A1I4RK64_9PROT|nr:Subtilase family protein [Nitrosomonas communis]